MNEQLKFLGLAFRHTTLFMFDFHTGNLPSGQTMENLILDMLVPVYGTQFMSKQRA
jgi:hypothetical protein